MASRLRSRARSWVISVFGPDLAYLAYLWMIRRAARWKSRVRGFVRQPAPPPSRLNFGCGKMRIPGWLNVDMRGSDRDFDFLDFPYPLPSGHFDAVVCLHVIEHFHFPGEIRSVLAELLRVLRPGGVLWLACPDLEKVCRAYLEDKGKALDDYLAPRVPYYVKSLPQQAINVMFHQFGDHKNLLDLDMVRRIAEDLGATAVSKEDEASFLAAFPEFPRQNDDLESLYVRIRMS